ncbi:hypothetical protein N7541_000245 [Penicillium brevicompactum]|uniref:Mg2+ transporter protein, CorA-like/Zinc transport protein ZntB n=1 Tax=Penicillium brevicompactum TaxID=5074 RepID=A0A9W9RWF5_PENBR|nr:hypothetical protein N7541_000245 [Penicillium brevicompactum]
MNDATKQRMLAVTRSSRETRYEFHSRDTALFYSITGEPMLHGSDARWINSLRIQRQIRSVLEWKETSSPLYCGLSILMNLREPVLEKKSLDDKLNKLKGTLRGSITANGLIPEQLNTQGADESQKPRRDSLLHIPFEVIYLLLHLSQQKNHQPDNKPADEASDNLRRLDGTVPFNDQIDERSIINLKEEWLYNYPSFLGFKPLHYDGSHPEFWDPISWDLSSESKEHEQKDQSREDEQQDQSREDEQQVQSREDKQQVQKKIATLLQVKKFQHLTIEVGRKSKAKGEREGQVYRDTDITKSWERLQQLRDERKAKKRLLWFQNAPPVLQNICQHISSDAERPSIQLFFESHKNCAVLVEDKATRAINLWETEFHCSFLQISRDEGAMIAPELGTEGLLSLPANSEFEESVLRRAKLGFRLHGDFFDRFWTCHFLEAYPGKVPQKSISDSLKLKKHVAPDDLFSGGRKEVWQQRKVLELILFDHIITQLNASTEEIIEEIEKRIRKYKDTQEKPREIIGKEPNPFTYFDPSRYFNTLREWALLHDALESLSVELSNLSEHVNLWEKREDSRGTEKPRWTHKDERKHRDAINKALQSSHNASRILNSNRTRVSSLLKNLQYMTNETKNTYDNQISERNFQQNNNVKFFTYATVIFQPLAFAASIYSMQSAPPTDVLQHMVILSIVGFAIFLAVIFSLPSLTDLFSLTIEKSLKSSAWAHIVKAKPRSVGVQSLQSLWKNNSSRSKSLGDEESGQQPVTTSMDSRHE